MLMDRTPVVALQMQVNGDMTSGVCARGFGHSHVILRHSHTHSRTHT